MLPDCPPAVRRPGSVGSNTRGPGPVAVGVIGCGDVAARYGEALKAYPEVSIVGATDRNPPRSAGFVTRFGGQAYASIDELLDDPTVEIVINLTRQHSHFEINERCLEAGKNVFSEKPLALHPGEARRLVELAEGCGVRLACAPVTFLGDAQQAVSKLVREGALGKVRTVYAEVNWGRIERWHPRPKDFYDVGPVVDVGVYPLTLLTAFFGPARRVSAFARILLPERRTLAGERFIVGAPDFTVALVELESGPVVRLTASFYTPITGKQRGIEIFGDDGSIHLASWHAFDAQIELSQDGAPYEPVAQADPSVSGVDYGLGPAELARALIEGRPHRGSGAHAAHVVEVLEAIKASALSGMPVEVASSFEPPAPE
jgi:predicted dehydrogenase